MANNCNKTFRDLINDGQAQVLGIVSEVPMGNWNATTTYQKLNFVRHNGATYKAKQANTRVEPSAATNWEDVWMLCNYDGGVSQVVSDGTYPDMTVGNATNAENANTATNAQQAQQAQKVVGSYEQLEDETYNLVIGVTGDAPNNAAITQINGEDLAGKEFYDYVRTEGAVLFSFNPNFSPAALYGGSWEKVMDRFPIGAGGSYPLGSTGGEANVTLTVDEMPSHTHGELVTASSPTGGWYSRVVADAGQNEPTVEIRQTAQTGGGQAHNNMPPYIGCNIWRKIA